MFSQQLEDKITAGRKAEKQTQFSTPLYLKSLFEDYVQAARRSVQFPA